MSGILFEEAKQALSWQQIMEFDKAQSNYTYCEIHGDTETPDLRIYEDGNWQCHACNATGQDLIRYVAQRGNINDYVAARQLIDEHGLESELRIPLTALTFLTRLRKGMRVTPLNAGPCDRCGRSGDRFRGPGHMLRLCLRCYRFQTQRETR